MFDVCFENQLVSHSTSLPPPLYIYIYTNARTDAVTNPSRSIELDVDIGADARDWSSIQAQEKLKPAETELRRIEEMVAEVVNEMEYLRSREQKLRDTNESTNERVKWFAFGTMGMLIGLGAWQVVYLRAYFRFVFFFFSLVFPMLLVVVMVLTCFFPLQIQASYLDGYILEYGVGLLTCVRACGR